ncbi:MAG TPA: glucose-1-phosphate cytidylyltransferase [Vicinamibacterales bacterium]|nr:glucose-1-phosphate cytidylyltransferase [Vicinamibacterales bacterium]
MKVVILCGGLGTRLREETDLKPKPMVEIGGRPILWHIMHHYAACGFKEFVLALGYRGEAIKRYFLDYHQLRGDLSVDLRDGSVTAHDGSREDWIVHLVDTGASTETGGRLKRLAKWIGNDRFLMTYGDGVSDVDVRAVLKHHEASGRLATVTAVRPPARFGGLSFTDDLVTEFSEKPQTGEGWINGGFFVFEPKVLEYIDGDHTILERDPLEHLTADGQLSVFLHEGFWQCMDTVRDLRLLENLVSTGRAPWKTWN